MTPLHMLVMQNDYKLMNQFLEFKHNWTTATLEMMLKDGKGRNPCDLAIEIGH